MQLTLSVVSGPGTGTTARFTAPRTVVIGRSREADFRIADAMVSRSHCVLTLYHTRATVKDLDSPNGTLLNRATVTSERELQTGDTIAIGTTEIGVELEVEQGMLADDTRHIRAGMGPSALGIPAINHPVCPICGRPQPGAAANRILAAPCAECRTARHVAIPGLTLGACVGRGSTGNVYEATDESGQSVAVKLLHAAPGDDIDEWLRRFRREVALAKTLVHDHLVRILSHGNVGAGLYVVMELVRGTTLKALIDKRGPLAFQLAVGIARQTALALAAMHERGIIHRDVKPENILVTETGVAKLTDFGLAKRVDRGTVITRMGEGMGTLGYMPPEQLEHASEADARSDVYSLGATLYHMIAGRKPFHATAEGNFYEEILHHEPPSLVGVRPDTPPVIVAIVERCLRKDPAYRYPSGAALSDDLARALASLSGSS